MSEYLAKQIEYIVIGSRKSIMRGIVKNELIVEQVSNNIISSLIQQDWSVNVN